MAGKGYSAMSLATEYFKTEIIQETGESLPLSLPKSQVFGSVFGTSLSSIACIALDNGGVPGLGDNVYSLLSLS